LGKLWTLWWVWGFSRGVVGVALWGRLIWWNWQWWVVLLG
jgi:hypothetical protein